LESKAANVPVDRLVLLGRVIMGLWAINFLLLITETVTYRGQGAVSLGLAVASVAIVLLRRKPR